MSPILLSVLIPSIPRRLPKLTRLVECLSAQADPRMEVLVMLDNCTRPLGWKRNMLMQHAQGRYLCHIDDDEMLAPDFFATLAPELEHGADVIGYDAGVSFNGSPEFRVRTMFGAACEQPRVLSPGHYSDIVRPFWHWCAWRSDLARRFAFPDSAGDEDWQWLRQVLPKVQTWRKVDRVLFHHQWSADDSTFPTT